MRKFLISIVFTMMCMTAPFAAHAQDATLHEVYQAANAGRLAEAQSMMEKVIKDHPNSAKAHYVEAELLAKQGKYASAKTELETAQRINPTLDFAKPTAVHDLDNLINRGTAASSAATPARQLSAPASSGISFGRIAFFVLLIFAGVMIFRALRRRTAPTVMPAQYGQYGNGQQPYYGPQGGMPGGGMGGPMASPGMGSGILGGLATGAALGAGVVAGEELMRHLTGQGNANAAGIADNAGFGRNSDNGAIPQNDNMGGNDFGIADNSSWDDGGSSSLSDSDMGGGGSDWS